MPRIEGMKSFTERRDHMNDDYGRQGYSYERNILRHVVSPEIFANPLNDAPMRQIERLFENLLRAVRRIKLHYAITFPPDSDLID